jgi:hypothetical protein
MTAAGERTVAHMKALKAGRPMKATGKERTLKAHVETSSRRNRPRVISFLKSIGPFEVELQGETDFIYSGESTPVVLALTELKYKFRVAYVQGWTLPEGD